MGCNVGWRVGADLDTALGAKYGTAFYMDLAKLDTELSDELVSNSAGADLGTELLPS